MNKTFKILSYSLLFFVSFMVFVLLTFPYEVLKEAISAEVSKSSGYSMSIGNMGPSLPMGLYLEKVEIANYGGHGFKVDKLKVSIPILPLLIGQVGLDLTANKGKGYLEVGAFVGILGILTGNVLPKDVEVSAEAFSIDDIIEFLFESLSQSPTMNPFLQSAFKQIGLEGELNADIDMSLDHEALTRSSGNVEIQLKDGVLKSVDSAFDFPKQKFSKALLKANIVKGAIALDQKSGFKSEGLDFGITGKLDLKSPFNRSTVALKLPLKMQGSLKDMLGSLVELALLGGQPWTSGEVTFDISGYFDQLNFSHTL